MRPSSALHGLVVLLLLLLFLAPTNYLLVVFNLNVVVMTGGGGGGGGHPDAGRRTDGSSASVCFSCHCCCCCGFCYCWLLLLKEREINIRSCPCLPACLPAASVTTCPELYQWQGLPETKIYRISALSLCHGWYHDSSLVS
jgi:hypothetical protein